MANLTVQLTDEDYERIEKAAKREGKSVQALVYEWIVRLSKLEESFDITQDSVFKMEGYDSDAPKDLSVKVDSYIY